MDLVKESTIRITLHAGEPGASIPSTKRMIEESWGAKCFDHPGATEVGAFGFECQSQPGGVHVNESGFIAEILNPTGTAVDDGEKGELVVTNLGRIGSPVIRYRTGDLVQPSYQPCPCGRPFLLLQGGVLGRVDDMLIIRGVNVFPSAIENVMREFHEIEEFRVEIFEKEALNEIKLVWSRVRTKVPSLGWRNESANACANASVFALAWNSLRRELCRDSSSRQKGSLSCRGGLQSPYGMPCVDVTIGEPRVHYRTNY